MKREYDFRGGKRGAVPPAGPGKTRITIRIDDDVLQWSREQVHQAGGGSCQARVNQALRRIMETQNDPLEETLRRVLREELPRHARGKTRGGTRR
jgi:hypothetical protein